ncbi:POTRA domain-containing protein, partial [Paramuribaculum intestinale]
MNKLSQIYRNLIAFAALALMAGQPAAGMVSQPADTVYNPPVVFNSMPRSYEIAEISVDGADNYEDHIVIGYSGLKTGERIEIPGDELTQAMKRLWRQGLFSKVQITVDKTADDKAWLTIHLREQPQ